MAVYNKNDRAYSIGQPFTDVFNPPIVSNRAPSTKDFAPIGQIWIDKPDDDVYFLTSIVANSATWISGGGGSGSFDSLAVTNATVIGGALSAAGAITFSGLSTAGVVLNSAAGLLSTSTGTDAQVLMADTAAGLDFGGFTSTGGTCVLTYPAPHTINIEATGGTANSYVTDAGGPVAPLLGLLNIIGYDANITTDGATANTVKVRLADDIVSVGSITASADFTMTAGTFAATSNSNAGQDIYLHANGGVNETIEIRSDQGTGNDSVYLRSDVGGLYLDGGLASVQAINLIASNAAGGMTIGAGTSGITTTIVNGNYTLVTGTGNILIGSDVTDHDVTIGDNSGVNAMSLVSGTGSTAMTSTGDITADAAGVIELNSSAGEISIANDDVDQNVNISTDGQRVTTIGSTNGTASVVVDAGTGGASFGASATAHATTIGSTNTTSSLTLQSGSGAATGTFGGILDINAVGAVTVDSTAGAISIGAGANDFAVNISTGGTRLTTIGNGTATSSVAILSGTSGIDVGVNAIAKTCRFGSTTDASATTIQAGSGILSVNASAGPLDINAGTDITIDSVGGIFDVSVTGNVTVDSSGGTIGIGVDDIDQNINIGTNGERVITIGNQVGAAGLVLESASAGMALNASGLTSVEVATDSQAAAAVTISANAGLGTFTGLTTATGAKQTLTVTNTLCTVGSAILATTANLGANDAKINIERVTPGAGSFTVDVINSGAAALNGDILLTFWILTV